MALKVTSKHRGTLRSVRGLVNVQPLIRTYRGKGGPSKGEGNTSTIEAKGIWLDASGELAVTSKKNPRGEETGEWRNIAFYKGMETKVEVTQLPITAKTQSSCHPAHRRRYVKRTIKK